MLDVTDRPVVIIGGGAVAVRKAGGLIDAGATNVRCVAPAFDTALRPEVQRVSERYEPRHLDGAALVFAATNDPEVNAAVVRDAHARGLLVNRADASSGDGTDAGGDFTTPARFNEHGVIVTVSAGSPALAVLIRNGIAQRWDLRWTQMAEAMNSLRPMLLARTDIHIGRRQQLFKELVTPEAMNALSSGGVAGLRAWLSQRFPELDHG
jgi:precorrin-2 dehydrogenase/sirohydrochlorin ferrochelatase